MNDSLEFKCEPLIGEEDKTVCIIRLTTSHWHDKKGMYLRKSLAILKRKCKGDYYDYILEDCAMVGADEIFPRIINLEECKDGLYQIVTCNEHRDWETGHIEDYDYHLIKYEEPKNKDAKSN